LEGIVGMKKVVEWLKLPEIQNIKDLDAASTTLREI